jgi:hypothetical protein
VSEEYEGVSCASCFIVGPYEPVARKRVICVDPDEVAENIAEKLVTGRGPSEAELLDQALLAIEKLTQDLEDRDYDTRW